MNQYQGAISSNTQTIRPSTNHYQPQQGSYSQNPYSINPPTNNYQSYQAHQISHNPTNIPTYHRVTSPNSHQNPQFYQQQPNKGFDNYRPSNNIPDYISPPHRR